jgi:integrase/recombinase XerD
MTDGLRALLSFLHVEGTLARSLVAAVPGVASWRLVGLPRGLEASEVKLVWASFDRRTNVGRRDFAIFLLLLRLGLRAIEAANLQLEDIDWRAGTLIVRGKGGRHERIPLPHDVGAALLSYLRHARPASALDRSVFVRMRAPHRGASCAVVKHAMAAAGRRAGLATRVGAHRLWHTVATALVAAGSPLPEVAQLLRHRSLQSTSIYAKVDLEALRSLARPWPEERA